MEEIRLWEIADEDKHPTVVHVGGVDQAKTEELLEEAIVACPDLLLEDLKLIGRQTDTPGGPLDLLGVDGDGNLAVFELKRGTLTRDAVAQVLDYGSYLAELDAEELAAHIAGRSGRLGIEKIEDFLGWYQEQFARPLAMPQKPRLVLVGLGVDERARRMVEFLADSEVDISLVTFHAFRKEGKILLARKVEVEAQPPTGTSAVNKRTNLAKLQKRVANLGVGEFYYEMAPFFQKELAAYQWPNPSGFSYYLPELTESGSDSNRVFVSLYLYELHPGKVQVRVHPRAGDVVAHFLSTAEVPSGRVERRSDGGAELWVRSLEDWKAIEPFLRRLCAAVVAGWKKKREQQAKSETQQEDERGDTSNHEAGGNSQRLRINGEG